MYYHYRKSLKKYRSFPAATDCHFCNPQKHAAAIHQETPHAYVIANRTFYDQWELRKVTDHRMVIPKRHAHTLSELSAEERVDIIDIIADYESRGYEVYARAPTSITRSVQHQHTHLIKADSKAGRGLFFLRKPYILWLFR